MKKITKRILQTISLSLIVFIGFGSMSPVFAQLDSDEDFRRFSISVNGGITFENANEGFRLYGSNFNLLTDETFNLGGGIQYAITPFWSVGADYRFINIEGRDGSFETDVHSIGLKNYFNFNRFYRRSSLSEYVNPYLTVGIGRDFFTFESGAERVSNNEMRFNAGFGLAFTLSNTFEIFGQYDQYASSNGLDNIHTGFPSDFVGMGSGGIRIYFGSRDQKPYSKSPPTIAVTDENFRDFQRSNQRVASMEQELSERDARINRLELKLTDLEDSHERDMQTLYRNLDQMSNRLMRLEEEIQEFKDQLEDSELVREAGITETLSAGHYVQNYASLSQNTAQSARQVSVSLLNNIIDNPEQKVIITQRKQYYEVRVGPFGSISNANTALDAVSGTFEDAFIITFPRPVSLQDEYSGIQVEN